MCIYIYLKVEQYINILKQIKIRSDCVFQVLTIRYTEKVLIQINISLNTMANSKVTGQNSNK